MFVHAAFMSVPRRVFLVSLAALAACGGDVQIAVTDRVPVVQILDPVADSLFWPGEAVRFCASIADEDPPEEWEVRLQSSVDAVISTNVDFFEPCDGGDLGAAFVLSEGEHTLSFSVTDALGQSGQDEIRVVGRANTPPYCEILEPDPGDIVRSDLPLRFEGRVDDTETASPELSVKVTSNLDGDLWSGQADTEGSVFFEVADLSGGVHLLTLEVEDPQGGRETCNVSLIVDACPDDDGDGYETCEGDCDDGDLLTFPGAPERPDGADNDCDAEVDEDTIFADDDSDGYGELEGDCDDANADVHPDAVDLWYDGVDSDCDGASDFDADYDGYDAVAHGGDDCDDSKSVIRPGALENWYDGVDQNCDGLSDYDRDGDGFDAAEFEGDDCDDGNAEAAPDLVEGRDGFDNNCDGYCDEGFLLEGDLLVTEIMYDSTANSDGVGEWFEVHNTTDIDIGLCKGFLIGDLGTGGDKTHAVDPTRGLVVPAGGYFVFGIGAAGSGGLPEGLPDYTYYGPLALANDGDRLTLSQTLQEGGTLVFDRVDWRTGSWPSVPTGGGASIQLKRDIGGAYYDATANDTPANWCRGGPFYVGAAGAGDRGTPGASNNCL
jgi:hypothetical protein